MTRKSELGAEGENFAERYLIGKGYKIIDRNKRKKWGELDIVAMAPDKTLVFIEVKTLRLIQGRPPEEQLMPENEMSTAKMKKSRRTAKIYAGSHQELINDKKGWRLDLVALIKKETAPHEASTFEIRHYENI